MSWVELGSNWDNVLQLLWCLLPTMWAMPVVRRRLLSITARLSGTVRLRDVNNKNQNRDNREICPNRAKLDGRSTPAKSCFYALGSPRLCQSCSGAKTQSYIFFFFMNIHVLWDNLQKRRRIDLQKKRLRTLYTEITFLITFI